MVTTPYYKGRNREYRALKILRNDGWVCSRSAMSHGPVDIFAAKGGKPLLIQVKSGKRKKLLKDELTEFVEWAKAFNAEAQIWYFKTGGPLEKKVVHQPPRR